MEKKKSIGPREALEHFYSMSGEIPNTLSDKMFPEQLSIISHMVEDGDYERERRAVARLIRDSCITLEQKEEIAQSIMNGKYRILDPKPKIPDRPKTPGTDARESERLKMTHLTMHRHELQRPTFLEIKTEAAPIPALNPREHRNKLVALLRQNSRPATTEHNRLKATLHTTKVPQVRQHLSDSMDEDWSKSKQMHLYMLDRKKKLEKNRVEVVLTREQAMRQKDLLQHSTERKVEIKKKLNSFRKKMKEYLVKQKNPLTGVIMRCVDESMVYHFMDKYDGFTMSVEAILALIGNSLGISLLYPEFPLDEDLEAAEAEQLEKHVAQNEKAFRNSIQLDDPRISSSGQDGGVFVDDNSEHTVADPELDHYLKNHFDEHQLQGDGALSRSMGRIGSIRSGSGNRGRTTPNLKLRRPRTEKKFRPHPLMPLIANASTLHASLPSTANSRTASARSVLNRRASTGDFESHANVLSRSGKYAQSPKGNHDAVVGIPQRIFSKDNRPPSPDKSFGGGYRATSAAEIRAKHAANESEIAGSRSMSTGKVQQHTYLPAPSRILNSPSQSFISKDQESISAEGSSYVFASANVRSAAKDLGLLQQSHTTEDTSVSISRGSHHSNIAGSRAKDITMVEDAGLIKEDSYVTDFIYEDDDIRAGNSSPVLAIEAMHDQLVEEDLLPSHQPERVLTTEQLLMLGTKKSSYEEIMQQVSKKNTADSQSKNISARGTADQAKGNGLNESVGDVRISTSDHDIRPNTGYSDPLDQLEPAMLEELSSGSYLSQFHRMPSRDEHFGSATDLNRTLTTNTTQRQQKFHREEGSGSEAVQELLRNKPPLHGTILSPLDRMRLERTAPQEIEAAEKRLLQNNSQVTDGVTQVSSFDAGMAEITAAALRPLSPLQYESPNSPSGIMTGGEFYMNFESEATEINVAASSVGFERVQTHGAGRAPRGIKTREGERDTFGNPAPTSPFKSWHEKQRILNSGVPAGAGLMLWRPRSRATKHGRYRVGQGFKASFAEKSKSMERSPPKRPFVPVS